MQANSMQRLIDRVNHEATCKSHGARRDAANLAMVMGLNAVVEEVERLIAEGHTILDVEHINQRPTISLLPTPKLAHLADQGQAAYYMSGTDQCGHYRKGQLLARGCNVVWVERGH